MSNHENVIDRILSTDTNVEVIVNGHDFTRDGTCESDFFTTEPHFEDEGFFEHTPGEW